MELKRNVIITEKLKLCAIDYDNRKSILEAINYETAEKKTGKKTAIFSVRMTAQEKSELENLFKNLGLTLTQAVQTFFAKFRMIGGLPYELREPKFSRETIEAMQEALDIKAGKIQAKCYDSVEEMFADNETLQF